MWSVNRFRFFHRRKLGRPAGRHGQGFGVYWAREKHKQGIARSVTAKEMNPTPPHIIGRNTLEQAKLPGQGTRSFYQRIGKLRWLAPLMLLALAAAHQVVLGWLLPQVPQPYHFWLAVTLYGLSGSVVVWLALGWLVRNLARQEQMEAQLRSAYDSLAQTHRQLLAVHDIGREIASADDMQQLLELAARAPVQLADAAGSAVVTWDENGDRLKLDMAWGLSDDYLQGLRQRMEAGIPAGRCRGCEHLTARVSDDCPLFVGMQDLARTEGIQSHVCLPITRDQERTGIISAYFPTPDGPPEEQVQLLNIVATEIASALDGIHLRANRMATLYAVENLARTEQDLGGLLEQVLNTALAGWGAPGGAILLYDEDDGIWHHWVHRGLGDDASHPRFDLALHLAEEVRKSRSSLLIPDLSQHVEAGAAMVTGLRSAAVAPLVAGGELLGALVMVADQPDLFEPDQASFFEAIAHQASLAIGNAQLHARVQQMAVLEERYRLSREMHDGLAQTLSALGWQLDRLKTLAADGRLETLEQELALGRRMVREAYTDVREAIDGLRLEIDHVGGLPSALEEYVAEFGRRTGIEVALELAQDLPQLSAETELQLLRIVQEALINVRKHAAAEHVWVRLQSSSADARVTLTVADDGQGFDPAWPRGRGHLGLSTMRERARSQGGDFAVVTGPEQGTRITVTLPFEHVASQG
jgi:signal transduction histidine kinase